MLNKIIISVIAVSAVPVIIAVLYLINEIFGIIGVAAFGPVMLCLVLVGLVLFLIWDE